jgi:hypothetical protein
VIGSVACQCVYVVCWEGGREREIVSLAVSLLCVKS